MIVPDSNSTWIGTLPVSGAKPPPTTATFASAVPVFTAAYTLVTTGASAEAAAAALPAAPAVVASVSIASCPRWKISTLHGASIWLASLRKTAGRHRYEQTVESLA